jgi:hypothetical protein
MVVELRRAMPCDVDSCSPEDLARHAERAIGAVVLTTPASREKVEQSLPPEQSPLVAQFTAIDEHLARIHRLAGPSLIGIVSVSTYFLDVARTLLAPAVGRQHTLQVYRLGGGPLRLSFASDLLLCDVFAYRMLRPRYPEHVLVCHEVLSRAWLDEVREKVSRAQRPGARRTRRAGPDRAAARIRSRTV